MFETVQPGRIQTTITHDTKQLIHARSLSFLDPEGFREIESRFGSFGIRPALSL